MLRAAAYAARRGVLNKEVKERASLVVKFLCLLHFSNEYLGGLALVLGPSMLPTLNLMGDILLVERLSVRFGKLKHGDIVMVRSPENPTKIVAKRIIGFEGDHITFLGVEGRRASSASLQTAVVPAGHLWIQGDNLEASFDSRHYGSVPYGLVQGKAFCRVWPIHGFGSL